jgi:molybdate transport system regulatory protein
MMENMKAPRPTSPRTQSSGQSDHGRIVGEASSCLDSLQLEHLEREFRTWAQGSRRADVALSRRRILLIFLLIRHTGAKLHEILALNPLQDIDHDRLIVTFGRTTPEQARTVPLSGALAAEIRGILSEEVFRQASGQTLSVDPAFVRRKFYERAEACGFPKNLASPEMIRKSRGVELMQSNMPLPAVQMYLGHSTPNLTSAYVTFSEDDIRTITSSFLQRESHRKTSARNSFFGKITAIRPADIQAEVLLTTLDGHVISSVITMDSLRRLGLKVGRLATVEVKAPWVSLYKSEKEPLCSSENRLPGVITQIRRGRVNTEYVLRIGPDTELCIVTTTESLRRLMLEEQDCVWAVFGSYATIVRVD